MPTNGAILPYQRRGRLGLFAVLLILAAAVFAEATRAEPVFPPLTGRIVDEAGLLSAADRAAIEAELTALEKASTDQLAVVTLKSLQGYAIEDFGYRLGRAWGIGQKGKDNGILLIVAPKERKVRIEVGRGLEPVMTDAMSKLIIDNAIVPKFRRGDFTAGIKAGVRDIKDVLLGDADAVHARAKRSTPQDMTIPIILFLLWVGIVLFILWAHHKSLQSQTAGHGLGKSDDANNSGGWSGGWSGGGRGGGGWSGGGGGFGGGGSSGSW